jgi:Skp family chaperone for outer membrane proteins
MSRLHGWALTLAIALSGWAVAQKTEAQQAGPTPGTRATPGPTVALLDVGSLFKNSQRHKAMREELKGDIERLKADSQTQKAEIAQLGERLRQLRNGTPDYQDLEAEIAKRQAAYTATFQLRSRDLARKEAKMLLDVYAEICDATNDYMRRNNIDVVLRFNSSNVDPDDPDMVREFITRPIVSYRTDLDITPAIVKYLDRPNSNHPVPGGQQGGPYR